MKKLFLLSIICCAISFRSYSQRVYLADTAFTTDVGFGGAAASCIAPHMYDDGWQMGRPQSTWLADEFTVPSDSTWVFDTVIVFGYQKGSGTTSTFLNCNLQIYSGTPGLGGAVIWGDTLTNHLVSTGFTGIYRVDTITANGGLTSTYRPVMYLKLYLPAPPVLTAGTYWLSWSAAGSLAVAPASPDKVLPGRINPSGQVARQLFGGVWYNITDSSQRIGMDMIIEASAGLAGITNVNKTLPPALGQNIPNPFNTATDISFYMPQAGPAKLMVYNTIGQLVATLTDGVSNAGEHHLTFNTGGLPAGIYYYQLSTVAGVESKQMLMVR